MKRIAPVASAFFLAASFFSHAAEQAEHVVVVVWDGMRPDLVTEQATPALYKLSREGVTFKNHHSVYVCSTEVNATALATGVYPNRSGIMANLEYRPAINPLKPIATQDLPAVRKGDEISGGKYIAAPTLAEILQGAGFRTVIAGTKPVALLHDRAELRTSDAGRNSINLFAGATLPAELRDAIDRVEGAFPTEVQFPATAQNAWTTKTLVEQLWKNEVPKFTLLWLGDPDLSQHQTGSGSEIALKALKNSDDNLTRVLAALDAKGLRGKTDVFVVSDHGFSTIEQAADVAKSLTNAGFAAFREFKKTPEPGQIMVVGNGGSVLFYIVHHERDVTRRLVDFLQSSEFAGVVFTREPMAGTFTLDQVRIDTPDAPDVVVSLRWNAQPNQFGVPGMIVSDGSRKPGQGNHATIGKFDVHNTLIAAGPDFQRGMSDEFPSGNLDLVPTILAILGVKPPQPMDGRVLREAFVEKANVPAKPVTTRIEAGSGNWRQYLQFTKVGDTIYFDEGNRHTKTQ